MKTARHFGAALSTAIALALSSAAIAAPADTAPRLVASNAGVQIAPAVDAPAYRLRVSGPDGKVVEDTHLLGEPMLVSPKLFGYARWLDGNYRFELVPVLGDRHRGDSAAASAPAPDQGAALTHDGGFQVVAGVVHLAGKTTAGDSDPAPPGMVKPADQVIPDDLIVQSSTCTGFDCVNGESFGFDTLRLKENNLRIHFDDTSASAGFPANDWRIIANDSASGGASKFVIEDSTAARNPFTIMAGAPNNAMFMSSAGNLGIGTSVPALDFHMTTTDTPAVRFEQTSAGGFTAQTWDIGANEANFFVRDVTGGSRLSLRIRPGAPTSSIDIAASGNVGVGTASPTSALHLSRAGNTGLRLQNTVGANANWELFSNSATGRLNITDDPTYARTPIKISTGAVDNLMRIGAVSSSTVEVNGTLVVNGNITVSGTVGPDYVFAPGFALPSIEEHAEFMTTNRHLPKVGPAKIGEDGQGVMDLGTLSHGMLEELEYAHLYIADLDRTVESLQQRLGERDQQIDALLEEMQAIRARLEAE